MTPEQAIKIEAFRRLLKNTDAYPIEGYTYPDSVDESSIDAAVDDLCDTNYGVDYYHEMMGEIRTSGTPSGLKSREYSRHYDCEEVVAHLGGRWVGWTYWYGGGKHGEPGAIDWSDKAYFVDVVEEQRTITVRTFTSQETGQTGKPIPML